MMARNEFSPLTNDVIYGCQWNLFRDEFGQALVRLYEAGVCDDYATGVIRHRVHKHKISQAFDGIPYRSPRLKHGNLVIGLDQEGKPLRIPVQFLNAHLLTVGGSGSGKTYRIKFYALQIGPHVRGMWLIDLRKREFRQLKTYLPRLGIKLIVLPVRSTKLNPLQVPSGVEPTDWVPRVSDMLIQVLSLPPRASKLLQRLLSRLYQRLGIFDGSEEYPTLFELFNEVRQDTGANAPARMALLDSLAPILSSLSNVLAFRKGWASSDLAGMHLALEFGGISETAKNLILNSLVLPEFTSRVAKGISNPNMDLWICCDEAQRLISSGGNPANQSNAIADLIGLVRGTGIGLDLSLQSTNGILPQITSNTATKVLGRCGSAADYASAGHSMGLSAEQIQWAQLNLRPGMFIGQLGEGSHRYPFVFTIPQMKFPQKASSQESLDDLGPLSSLPTVPAKEFQAWGDNIGFSATPATKGSSAFESDREYRLCKAIAENPLLASSKYPKLAGISSKTAGPLRLKLIARGLVREHVLDSGKRGPSSLILEATPEGVKAIQEYESGRGQDKS